MLRLSHHTSARLAHVLQNRRILPPETLREAIISSSTWRRDFGSCAPHATGVRGKASSLEVRSTQVLRPHDDRRRLVGVRGGQCPRDYNGLNQRRDLSSGGNAKDGKDKKGREEEGLLDRLKKMMGDEIEKNPALKEKLSQLKEAEQKLRENPTVKENLSKLNEAEKKLWSNPGVKEKLSQIKQAEKKFREDAKDKQGEFMEQAEKAREKARDSGGFIQEKYQQFKETVGEKLGGASSGGEGKGEEGAENEFVRASKEKFSGAQKVIDENSILSKIRARTQAFREAVGGASSELFSPADKKAENAVVKKLKQPKKRRRKKKDTDGKKADGAVGAKEGGQGGDVGDDEEEEGEEEGEEEEEEEKGGVASLMIVKTAGEAWERLQERLKEAPIIQELLGASRVVAAGSLGKGAKAAKDTVKDKVEDVQEAWETSQHPLVYKLSSAWDSLTAESDEGIGVRELRRLDPSFSVEDWKRDIQELFLPEFMSAFLRGDVETLKQWTGEACFNKLASEAKQRKAEGMVLDPNVLDVRQGEVIAIKADAGKANPTVAFQFMCQQINCVRNKKGEIVEGDEDDIRATYYILAFQREFNDNEAELRWKVVDMMVVGAYPWY